MLIKSLFFLFIFSEFYKAATAAEAALAISRSASTVPPDTPMEPMNLPVLVLKSKDEHGELV